MSPEGVLPLGVCLQCRRYHNVWGRFCGVECYRAFEADHRPEESPGVTRSATFLDLCSEIGLFGLPLSELFDQATEPTRCPLCAAPFGDDVLSGDSWAYCSECGWVDHG